MPTLQFSFDVVREALRPGRLAPPRPPRVSIGTADGPNGRRVK
jgi:hypothetical protein